MRVACVAGLALAVVAARPVRGDEWSHQYPLQGVPQLHVRTDDGRVRIETVAGSEIEARVTTAGWRIAPDEVTITESQAGNRVDIEVRIPKRPTGTASKGDRSTSSCACRSRPTWTSRPATAASRCSRSRASVDLSTGDGSITAQGLHGHAAPAHR